MKNYQVTKRFTEGILKGMTITETTSVKFEVGRVYGTRGLGSPYVVTSCMEVR